MDLLSTPCQPVITIVGDAIEAACELSVRELHRPHPAIAWDDAVKVAVERALQPLGKLLCKPLTPDRREWANETWAWVVHVRTMRGLLGEETMRYWLPELARIQDDAEYILGEIRDQEETDSEPTTQQQTEELL